MPHWCDLTLQKSVPFCFSRPWRLRPMHHLCDSSKGFSPVKVPKVHVIDLFKWKQVIQQVRTSYDKLCNSIWFTTERCHKAKACTVYHVRRARHSKDQNPSDCATYKLGILGKWWQIHPRDDKNLHWSTVKIFEVSLKRTWNCRIQKYHSIGFNNRIQSFNLPAMPNWFFLTQKVRSQVYVTFCPSFSSDPHPARIPQTYAEFRITFRKCMKMYENKKNFKWVTQ